MHQTLGAGQLRERVAAAFADASDCLAKQQDAPTGGFVHLWSPVEGTILSSFVGHMPVDIDCAIMLKAVCELRVASAMQTAWGHFAAEGKREGAAVVTSLARGVEVVVCFASTEDPHIDALVSCAIAMRVGDFTHDQAMAHFRHTGNHPGQQWLANGASGHGGRPS